MALALVTALISVGLAAMMMSVNTNQAIMPEAPISHTPVPKATTRLNSNPEPRPTLPETPLPVNDGDYIEVYGVVILMTPETYYNNRLYLATIKSYERRYCSLTLTGEYKNAEIMLVVDNTLRVVPPRNIMTFNVLGPREITGSLWVFVVFDYVVTVLMILQVLMVLSVIIMSGIHVIQHEAYNDFERYLRRMA